MENKLTKGVFINIMSGDIDNLTKFLNEQKSLKKGTKVIPFHKEFKSIVQDHMDTFDKLSMLEEIILQDRAINNMDEIKFSTVRDYIYARTDFFRNEKFTKDIRVIVAKISDVTDNGDDLDMVYKDQRFIEVAKSKLIDSMKKELNKSITNFQLKYETN